MKKKFDNSCWLCLILVICFFNKHQVIVFNFVIEIISVRKWSDVWYCIEISYKRWFCFLLFPRSYFQSFHSFQDKIVFLSSHISFRAVKFVNMVCWWVLFLTSEVESTRSEVISVWPIPLTSHHFSIVQISFGQFKDRTWNSRSFIFLILMLTTISTGTFVRTRLIND